MHWPAHSVEALRPYGALRHPGFMFVFFASWLSDSLPLYVIDVPHGSMGRAKRMLAPGNTPVGRQGRAQDEGS